MRFWKCVVKICGGLFCIFCVYLKFFCITSFFLKFLVIFCWYFKNHWISFSLHLLLVILPYTDFMAIYIHAFSLSLTWPVTYPQHTGLCCAPCFSKGFLPCQLTFSILPSLSLLFHWAFVREEICTLPDTIYSPLVQTRLTTCSPAACLHLLRRSVVFICVSEKHST